MFAAFYRTVDGHDMLVCPPGRHGGTVIDSRLFRRGNSGSVGKVGVAGLSGDGPQPESIRIIASRRPPPRAGELHRRLDDHEAPPARRLALDGLGFRGLGQLEQ